jgi:hypothetical protein
MISASFSKSSIPSPLPVSKAPGRVCLRCRFPIDKFPFFLPSRFWKERRALRVLLDLKDSDLNASLPGTFYRGPARSPAARLPVKRGSETHHLRCPVLVTNPAGLCPGAAEPFGRVGNRLSFAVRNPSHFSVLSGCRKPSILITVASRSAFARNFRHRGQSRSPPGAMIQAQSARTPGLLLPLKKRHRRKLRGAHERPRAQSSKVKSSIFLK